MARIALPILSLLLGAACAVALVSCGGGSSTQGLLPGGSASQIVANIDSVKAAVAAGDCAAAHDRALAVADQVNRLGSSVDPKLREALRAEAANLAQLAPNACQTTSDTTAAIDTSPASTQQPATTDTGTSTKTTPPKTTTTTTQPTAPTPTAPTTPTQSNTTTPTTPTTGGTSAGGTGGGKRSGRHR